MNKEDDDLMIAYMCGYNKANFERDSRTCDCCRYYGDSPQEGILECHAGVEFTTGEDIPEYFGCNKFSRKEE